jgi:hypothetical protein
VSASVDVLSVGSARDVGGREEQEDELVVQPQLFEGYTYVGACCSAPLVHDFGPACAVKSSSFHLAVLH